MSSVALIFGNRDLGKPIFGEHGIKREIGIVRILDFPDLGTALSEGRRLKAEGIHVHRIMDSNCETIFSTGAELDAQLN